MRAPASLSLFDDHHVPHTETSLETGLFQHAAQRTQGISTVGFPATVTVPGFEGCLRFR